MPGLYRFPDALQPGKIYTGRSVDIAARLEIHIANDKLDPADAAAISIIPDAQALENTFIHYLGGPQSANALTNAANRIWGPGARKPR